MIPINERTPLLGHPLSNGGVQAAFKAAPVRALSTFQAAPARTQAASNWVKNKLSQSIPFRTPPGVNLSFDQKAVKIVLFPSSYLDKKASKLSDKIYAASEHVSRRSPAVIGFIGTALAHLLSVLVRVSGLAVGFVVLLIVLEISLAFLLCGGMGEFMSLATGGNSMLQPQVSHLYDQIQPPFHIIPNDPSIGG